MLESQARPHISKRAFTLIELLVVIAIIAILAAILFPVFAQARAAANKTVDISNMRQISMAHTMYANDNDEHMPMSNTGGYVIRGWGYGPPDSVPGMQMMPYVKNDEVWFSKMDPNTKDRMALIRDHITTVNPQPTWNINNLTPAQRLYGMMVRSNIGYNYLFFSPWRNMPTNPPGATSYSLSIGEITATSATIMWGTSLWDRNAAGAPKGGGNWVIEAPCDLNAAGAVLRPRSQFVGPGSDGTGYQYTDGWCLNTCSPSQYWLAYGGLWPFHNQQKTGTQPGLKDGHVIIGMADGSVKSMPVRRTLTGCNPLGTLQGRLIAGQESEYMWDLE